MKNIMIVLLALLLLMSGCGTDAGKEYQQDYSDIAPKGEYFCHERGLDFAGVFTPDLKDWHVVCLKKSPAELRKYDID